MRFYVYEYYIIDTGEVFYVGKGTGKRKNELHNRSKYFMSVYNKYKCDVRIILDGLTNEQSCQAEIERIAEMKAKGLAKCNFTYGGTGFSEGDLNPIHKRVKKEDYINPFTEIDVSGENNPFYGKQHTDETKQKISESRKGKGGQKGELNPMFGSDKTKGEKNGMYGKKGKEHPNSKIYLIHYHDGTTETLLYKECEKKFGIAFSRIYENGGELKYKKNTPNKVKYEGIMIERIK